MSPRPPATTLHVSRLGWLSLGLAVLLPWLGVIWLATRDRAGPAPATTTATVAAPAKTHPAENRLPPGPWGNLSFSRIAIEPPEDLIPFDYTSPEAVRWVFHDYPPQKLLDLWRAAGLSPEQIRYLTDPARQSPGNGTIQLKLDADFVLALSAGSRAVIYTALGAFAENTEQRDPFRFRAEFADEWFRDSGISPAIMTLTKSLLYQRAGQIMFSDSDVVLPKIAGQAERTRFIKTLSRKSTFLVQLRIEEGANVEALARYWGVGRRSKDVLPLLQSLARRPGGSQIDLIHLLPPFPRSLLYTYPLPSSRPEDSAHDCHWTSLNFSRQSPDDRLANIEVVKQTLLENYYLVPGAPALGDVVVLVHADGVVAHSCVYIAADVVFTKNGSSFSVPWVLSNLDTVVAFYSVTGPVEVRRFRLKDR